MKKKDQNEDLNVGRGKLEIQNQDSHFSTAQISLRRKEKGRLHKTLDAPETDGARSAHEALPHTPPGGTPPETPAPFPWSIDGMQGERICQGFATPAQNAALDRFAALAKRGTELG